MKRIKETKFKGPIGGMKFKEHSFPNELETESFCCALVAMRTRLRFGSLAPDRIWMVSKINDNI